MNGRQSASVVGIAILILLATPEALAAQQTQGFAAYGVTVTLPSGQHSVVVNVSARPSDRAGFSIFTLQLTGGEQNLTYSRLVTASTNLLPYLPSLPAQSFDYSNGTRYSIHANFSSGDTTVVTFRGTQYTLNVYSITVLASYGDRSVSAKGTIETFPSALVYSITASGGGAEVQALLQATDLALVDPSPQTATAAYVGAGIGVGGIALAAALLMRRRERKAARTQDQKPMHWVD